MESRRQEVGAWSSRRLNIFVICDLFQSPVWASEGRSGINCDFKRIQNYNKIDYKGSFKQCDGDVAQMVERSLSMREVRGSIPRISNLFFFFFVFFSFLLDTTFEKTGEIVWEQWFWRKENGEVFRCLFYSKIIFFLIKYFLFYSKIIYTFFSL